MAALRSPISLVCSLSDVVHRDDDTIEVAVRVLAADGGQRSLIEADVTSRFWAEPRVRDYDVLRVAAPSDDVDALVLAIFEFLGARIREFGSDHVDACYPDFRDFLADHLPPAVAARLDAALCLAMPKAAHGDTISFSV